MGSKSPSNTTQVVSQTPGPLELAAITPFHNLLNLGTHQLSTLLGGGGFGTPIPRTTFGQNNLETGGQNALLRTLQAQIPSTINRLQGVIGRTTPFLQLGENLASQAQLSPQDNPVLQNLLKASLDPVSREFQEVLRPQLSSQDVLTQGGAGGTRGQVLQAQLGQRHLQTLGELSSQIVAQQQQQQIQNALASGQLSAGLLSGIVSPTIQRQFDLQQLLPRTQIDIGTQRRQNELAQRQNELAERFLPFDALQRFAQLLGAGGSGTPGPQTTTQSGGGGRGGGLLGGLGGALTGGALGGALNAAQFASPLLSFGTSAALAPFLGPVGAGLGLLGGLGLF